MNNESSPVPVDKSFEGLKYVNSYGAVYWSVCDLQYLLGYSQWRCFELPIERARISRKKLGNRAEYLFAGAGKMVEVGSGSHREVNDFQPSHFACYLIAQNNDPCKPELAQAQKYFVIQTHRQELLNDNGNINRLLINH